MNNRDWPKDYLGYLPPPTPVSAGIITLSLTTDI